jgi:hypothetical protein
MIRIYYHVYIIDGVEAIISEQLELIKKWIDRPYSLTVGISVAEEGKSADLIIKFIQDHNMDTDVTIGDIKVKDNEFVTLNLIERDKQSFLDTDYILYLHTKGASRQNDPDYSWIKQWRNRMQLFNIQYINDVFNVLDSGVFNTYGYSLETVNDPTNIMYSGNFWWLIGSYAKTIDITDVDITNRSSAELHYIQKGDNWKPYSVVKRGDNWEPYSDFIKNGKNII